MQICPTTPKRLRNSGPSANSPSPDPCTNRTSHRRARYDKTARSKWTPPIARARRQVELLQEYRTRLLADVVTGKLDVREAAAQLPDEADDQDPLEESGPLADGMGEDLHAPGELAEEMAMPSNMP